MLRVAREARLFPLLTLDRGESPHMLTLYGGKSLHMGDVTEALDPRRFGIEMRRVPYEFQGGGNEMLLVHHV